MKKQLLLVAMLLTFTVSLFGCQGKSPELFQYAVTVKDGSVLCEDLEWGMSMDALLKKKGLSEDAVKTEPYPLIRTEKTFSAPYKTAVVEYFFEDDKFLGGTYYFSVKTEDEYISICAEVAKLAGAALGEPKMGSLDTLASGEDGNTGSFESTGNSISINTSRPSGLVEDYTLALMVRAPR